jgi:hypothetical protein
MPGLFAVVLFCHSLSACSSLSPQLRSARFAASNTVCYLIADCRFVSITCNIASALGGAIQWRCSTTGNILQDCIFYRCVTNDDISFGGGCGFDVQGLTVSRCCGYQCSSAIGQLFYVSGCANPSVSLISCLQCAPSSIRDGSIYLGEYGALYFADGTDPAVSLCNFTRCYTNLEIFYDLGVWPDACAIMLDGGSGTGDASLTQFCNFVRCNGRTGFNTQNRRVPRLTSCNFYGNEMVGEPVWLRSGLLRLQYCYFASNVGLNGAIASGLGSSVADGGQMSLSYCYFDGPLPSVSSVTGLYTSMGTIYT